MTVYFKPPRTWSTAPRIHFWNAVPAGNIANTTWPGMTMVSDVNGFFIYTIVGPTSVNIVFNNGNNVSGNQTVDLLNKTNNYSFTYGGAARLTNIEDNEFDFVSVFPNPVIDLLQISSNRVVLNYRITTLQIVVLKEGQPIDNKVDVSHLTSGLYFLQLTLKNGEEQIKRIVKK